MVDKLKSRKFLLVVLAAAAAAINGDWTAAYSLIAAYLGVQGLIDGVAARKGQP